MPGRIAHAISRLRAFRVTVPALLACLCAPASALADSGTKTVSYHGYRVSIPRQWPVFDLAKDPTVCLRFNRHALYLGTPGAQQRCPSHAAGRTEAIWLAPDVARADAADALPNSGADALTSAPGSATGSLVNRVHGVLITATWRGGGAVVRRALGLRSLSSLSSAPAAASGRSAHLRQAAHVASAAPSAPGGVFTGLGFDVCSTPSASHMAAWGSSPYRAVGVYIGGANMACSQPNLTPGWVSQESTAGWHLIPIYVGLQAPSNSCGCAAISASSASSQGAAAASDAVTKAEALGLGIGNPIYFDMEAYSRGSTNSPAVLDFLGGWTARLHADGYKSGVYVNDNSGVRDLVGQYGSGYTEPDDIWMANWNGAQTTSDANVPSGEWTAHQRLHQYSGGHNETHGGVTINVDGNYLDAATAAAGGSTGSAGEWSAGSPPTIAGQALVGQTLTEGHGNWAADPTSYAYQWEDCNPSGGACVQIPGATGPTYTLGPADIGHTVRVVETASTATATSVPATSRPTGQVLSLTPLYWLYTAYGNVDQSLGTAFYGSPVAGHYRGSSITGMAATPDGKGYWLVTRTGSVYAYGDATRLLARHLRLVRGIVAAPNGYWLYTTTGKVYSSGGAVWYGSPSASHYRGTSIVGMAATPDGRGYWLVTSAGRVYAYGDARRGPGRRGVIRGVVAAPGGGYWLYTAYGNVSPIGGAGWYGSPQVSSRYHGSSIVGMTTTSDGDGYWLVTSGGRVFAYGDAAWLTPPKHPHPITGMVG